MRVSRNSCPNKHCYVCHQESLNYRSRDVRPREEDDCSGARLVVFGFGYENSPRRQYEQFMASSRGLFGRLDHQELYLSPLPTEPFPLNGGRGIADGAALRHGGRPMTMTTGTPLTVTATLLLLGRDAARCSTTWRRSRRRVAPW